MTPLNAYLAFAVLLFGVGLYGLVQRRSLVAMLIALELMLASVSIIVVAVTAMTGSDASLGQVIALILLGVAASEAAVALALWLTSGRVS